MYQQILIALEGQPTDEAAIAHATALARQRGHHLLGCLLPIYTFCVGWGTNYAIRAYL